jgi:cell wall assembly regulator SMI1
MTLLFLKGGLVDTVRASWQRIDAWIQQFAPSQADTYFYPGVSQEQIAHVEAALGLELPEDVKESYRIHNGGKSILGWETFDSIEAFDESGYSQLLQEPGWVSKTPQWVQQGKKLPVEPVWRHPSWLDFTTNGAGDTLCIDLSPTAEGTYGQILDWGHETGVTKVLFSSFRELLSVFALHLEAGIYGPHGGAFVVQVHPRIQERRAAFLADSPGKPLIREAYRNLWNGSGPDEELFDQAIALENATLEDRFFASYAIHKFINTDDEALLKIANSAPGDHWIRDEIPFF